MNERVVENWLTSVNERQYQIPFSQVLASEGETVVYISSHGQMELGKDIVTVAPDGTPRAYQLKKGDIGQRELRNMWGELEELVTLDLNYPQLHTDRKHESYLVTNGEITDPALNHIKEANNTWARKGLGPLKVIQCSMLVSRFQSAHGKFFPQDINDLNLFLELYVRNGRLPQDKSKLSSLLASSSKLNAKKMNALDVKRAASSIMLLTSYLDTPSIRENNYWRSFENWVIAASTICALATKFKVRNSWQFAFDQATELAISSLESLKDECIKQSKPHLSSPFSEGYIYPNRLTLICGLLSAHVLVCSLKKAQIPDESEIITWIESRISECRIAGEVYVLYFLLTCYARELRGMHLAAERTAFAALQAVLSMNTGRNRGLPNLYYGPEESLRFVIGRDQKTTEMFSGFSYTGESLILYQVKRLNRNTLKQLWYKITDLSYMSFRPHFDWEWFCYSATEGTLDDRRFPHPTSWAKLLDEANRDGNGLPTILRDAPWFTIMLIMVYPHRWNSEVFRFVDTSLRRV